MKKLFAVALLCLSWSAYSNCALELKFRGIFWNECPRGYLADGVDVRVSGNPPFPFTDVRVRCVEPILTCVADKPRHEKPE